MVEIGLATAWMGLMALLLRRMGRRSGPRSIYVDPVSPTWLAEHHARRQLE